MFLLDVNVVLAGTATTIPNTACPLKVRRRTRGRGAIHGARDGWASFLRQATNRRIFEVPTPRPDAFAFIEATCAQPLHIPVAPGPGHLAVVRRLCEEADAVGDLVTDAVIGAIAVEYSCELVSLDRDFARFRSIRHVRPPST